VEPATEAVRKTVFEMPKPKTEAELAAERDRQLAALRAKGFQVDKAEART
jgi:hypothetical protein